MSRLTKLVFGNNATNEDIDKVVAMIDVALEEHRQASIRHEQSLEALKKEIRRVEAKGEPPNEAPASSQARRIQRKPGGPS